MQNKRVSLLGLFALAAAASTASAVPTSFSTSTVVSSNDDISNFGPAVLAYDASGITQAFTGGEFSGATTQNGVTLSIDPIYFSNNQGSVNLSASLEKILGNIDATYSYVPFTIGLSGLTPDTTYVFQLFSGTPDGTNAQGLTDGSAMGTLNYGTGHSFTSYVDLTFTTPSSGASDDVQSVTVTPSATGSQFGIINAVDLEVLPEPSTISLMATAIVGLALWFAARATSSRPDSIVDAG
jgi:hypothetical protein